MQAIMELISLPVLLGKLIFFATKWTGKEVIRIRAYE